MSAGGYKTQDDGAHASSHLCSELVVFLFIPFRLYILSAWVELHADIPFRSRI